MPTPDQYAKIAQTLKGKIGSAYIRVTAPMGQIMECLARRAGAACRGKRNERGRTMGSTEDMGLILGDMEFGDCSESPNGYHLWRLDETSFDLSRCRHCGDIAQTSHPLLPPDRYRRPRAKFPMSESTEVFGVGDDVYEWDRRKRIKAMEKHRVDFKDIAKFVWDPEQTTMDRCPLFDENGVRIGYENRIQALGHIDEKLHLVVYTRRGDNFRIISMHRVGEEELLPHKICLNCRWPEEGPDLVFVPGSPHDTIMNCGYPGPQKGRKIRLTDTCDKFEDSYEWWIRESKRRPPSGGMDYDEARIKAYYGEYE